MPYARSSDGFKLYYEEHGRAGTPLVLAYGIDPSLAPMKVIQRRIRGSKLVVLSPASHFANRDQPEAWNRAALQFLTRVDGGGKRRSG